MNLENYGYMTRELKIRPMNMSNLRIGLYQLLSEKNFYARIRVVDTFCGTSEEYQNLNEFMMAEYNDDWEINLLNVHSVDMYDEKKLAIIKTIVVVIESQTV